VTEIGPEQFAGVREGQILAGKYRVERVLGIGGMGVVVAARHIELDSRVALKFLLPALLANQEAVARFAREARALVKIQNEHVARVLDVGTLDNGAPYMVMEFLEGEDLAEWLRRRGPMHIEQGVEFIIQACVAVADAHGLGIVHRDLKPANLFCIRRSDGQFVIKVLDFGISKLTDASRASEPPGMSVTKTSAVIGSPLYMSPEQMRSAKDVDAQTDIWSLGIMMFQLFTGRTPFLGETVTEVAVQVGSDPPPPLRSFRPDAPAGLEAVIFKCLEKDRCNRYRNVAELAQAILPFAPARARTSVDRIAGIVQAAGQSAGPRTIPALPQAGDGTLIAPQTPETVSPWTRSEEGSASKKAMLSVAALIIAVLAVIGGTAAVRRSLPSSPAMASAPAVTLASPSTPAATPTTIPTTIETVSDPLPPLGSATPAASSPAASSAAAGKFGRPPAASLASHAKGLDSPARVQAPNVSAQEQSARSEPSAKPNCDPNFYLDEQGQKHFKRECF
jgi:serine/threonine-protein kinase